MLLRGFRNVISEGLQNGVGNLDPVSPVEAHGSLGISGFPNKYLHEGSLHDDKSELLFGFFTVVIICQLNLSALM